MKRDQFNYLFTNITALTEDEAAQMVALIKEYPYSQVIHSLAARASQDAGLPQRETILHLSALYSTDRLALKSVMTEPRKKRMAWGADQENTIHPTEEVISSGLPLHEQILKDIEAMHESKRLFEEALETLERTRKTPQPADKKTIEPEKKVAYEKSNDLIEEIRLTKKKVKPDKQREQDEIIDQFIKAQPTISRPQPTAKPEKDSDLSEPGNQFSESIVSETLVEILLKQGKKEKAIEALKKLIWKFPQKKAYFAAQIEELRK
ncbi:MAG: hypothetical protein JST69_03415 [Bacteroidetes bacterium]|nr:hypothetical protein [Bacteroidota bacterium]